LIEHLTRTDREGALRWLTDAGLIEPSTGEGRGRTSLGRRPSGTSRLKRSELTGKGDSPSPTAPLAAAILAAAVPADDTPGRDYLAGRGTWTPAGIGPDLPPTVRWLPADIAEQMRHHDGDRERRVQLPYFAAGAVVYELARPGEPPDAVDLEAVNADGKRMDRVLIPPPPPPGQPPPPPQPPQYRDRWRQAYGSKREHVFEVPAATGDPWPDSSAAPLVVAVAEGLTDALALARLRLPGVLVRATAGTSGMNTGARLVADIPPEVVVCLVSDGDKSGWKAATKLHKALHEAGHTCYSAVLARGDLDELLRNANDADLEERHNERAAALELDVGLSRSAASAWALARLIKSLPAGERND